MQTGLVEVEDATFTLLHFLYHHVEGPKAQTGLFPPAFFTIDFYSAFNTIQSHLK